MRLGHFLDARDPVLDQAVVVVGHGGADAAALVVAAHDDILDLFILGTRRETLQKEGGHTAGAVHGADISYFGKTILER